jgi:hypothetical protein
MELSPIRNRCFLLFSILMAGVAAPSHATIISCQYGGTVTQSSDPNVPLNTPLSGTFLYDPDEPGSSGGSSQHIFSFSSKEHGLSYFVGP